MVLNWWWGISRTSRCVLQGLMCLLCAVYGGMSLVVQSWGHGAEDLRTPSHLHSTPSPVSPSRTIFFLNSVKHRLLGSLYILQDGGTLGPCIIAVPWGFPPTLYPPHSQKEAGSRALPPSKPRSLRSLSILRREGLWVSTLGVSGIPTPHCAQLLSGLHFAETRLER